MQDHVSLNEALCVFEDPETYQKFLFRRNVCEKFYGLGCQRQAPGMMMDTCPDEHGLKSYVQRHGADGAS